MRSFDTETPNRPGGGYAVLLASHDGENPSFKQFPKTFSDIFDFLACEKDPYYMCWNMDFDARAILHERYTSYKILETLAVDGVGKFRGYGIKFLPRKFLRVWKKDRHFELYDLAQFYGTSLKVASEKYLGQAEQKKTLPERVYHDMDKWLSHPRYASQIIEYAGRDVEATHKLFVIIERAFAGMSIHPRKWISAASLSVQIFKRPLLKEPRIPLYVQNIFQKAFYGGRVEVGTLGRVGPCRLYDIHSAYPSELAKLHSLKKGYFHVSEKNWVFNPWVLYGAYKIKAKIPQSWHWGPLAVRHRSELLYPVGQVKTWVCLPAIRTLQRLGLEFNVLEAYEYIGYGESPLLFSGIKDLYAKRRDPKISLAVKLVLNSLYGKLCESRRKHFDSPISGRWLGFRRIASREVYGKFANFILASHLTEAVRLKVWETLHRYGKRAYFAATDSVLISGRLKTGPGLGQWGHKMNCDHAVILGCGRYFLQDKDAKTIFQFRGFAPSAGNLARLKNAGQATVKITDFRTPSLVEWAKTGGDGDFNVLRHVPLSFKVEDTKRFFPAKFGRIKDAFKRRLDSEPYLVRQ